MGQISDISAAFTVPLIQRNVNVNQINVENDDKGNTVMHNLEHLTAEQRKIVSTMLSQEQDVFSKSKNDIGHIKSFELDINLCDGPLVNIFLNNQKIDGLWDTGAMISLMNEEYLSEKFPQAKVLSIAEFTGSDSFELTAANQSSLCVKGVTILTFGVEENQNLFEIPFLVTSEDISNPIIGYNTIEHLVENFKGQN